MKNFTLRKTFIGLFVISTFIAGAQNVAINTSGNAAVTGTILDLSNNLTNGTTAFLAPYVSLTSLTVLAPVTGAGPSGLLVYNTNASLAPDGIGYYFWTGSTGTPANTWVYLYNTGTGPQDWLITGNSNIVDGTNFLGTTTDIPLTFKVDGSKSGRIEDNTGTNSGANTFFGYLSGSANTPVASQANTGFGYQALKSNTTATENTAVGYNALGSITTGASLNVAMGFNAMPGTAGTSYFGNTALGAQALFSVNNASASNNTAVGLSAMFHTSTGGANTMIGEQSGENNTTGGNNTALGLNTLFSNVAGNNGTAIGYYAMYYANSSASSFTNTNVAIGYQAIEGSATAANNTGVNNTGVGYDVLTANVAANDNTAIGYEAMLGNTYSKQNVAVGSGALQTQSYTNTTTAWATDNTALGYNALKANQPTSATTGYENTSVGSQSLDNNTSGAGNTALGYLALSTNTTGTNNMALGYEANVASGALTNATAIGASASAGISNSIILGQLATPTLVGIGTSTPLQLLHVNGVEQLGTATTKQGSLIFANTTANSVTLEASNSTTAAYTMTLPTAAAAAVNYVLASTGANATLQWVNPATTFTTAITANNGAYMSSPTNVQFGTNPLVANTTLPLNTFSLTETGTLAGPPIHQVENASGTGIALGGENTAGAGTGNGTGLYGSTAQSGGYGVEGINTYSFGGGTGVYGTGGQYGVEGVSSASVGVLGSGSTGTEGNGTQYGVYGIGPTAVYGDANNSSGSSGGNFSNNAGGCYTYAAYYNGTTYYGIYSNSEIYSSSTKSTLVQDEQGNTRAMYCDESPEVIFHDYGTASLVNGRIHIDLDPILAKNVAVNDKHPLRVILTMNEECPNSLFVTNRTATGFDVVEMNHGTSNASFTYEVIANRADKVVKKGEQEKKYSDMRFPLFQVPPPPTSQNAKAQDTEKR